MNFYKAINVGGVERFLDRDCVYLGNEGVIEDDNEYPKTVGVYALAKEGSFEWFFQDRFELCQKLIGK